LNPILSVICERFSPSFLGLSGHPNCSSFAVLFPAFSGSETDLISGVLRLPKRNLGADEFCAAEFVLIGLLRRVSQESSDEAKSERKIGRICALSKFSHLSVRQCEREARAPSLADIYIGTD